MHTALASTTRRRLLELLQVSQVPRDVHDLAAQVGRHTSTVRFHLEVLRTAGLVARVPRAPSGTGRPRSAYVDITADGTQGVPPYQGLAALLAAHLSDSASDRTARAERAGRTWAEQAVPRPRDDAHSMDDAAARVTRLFAELGFQPALIATAAGHQIELHACPFRAVAREHPEVVCSVHLGLLRGSLARLGVQAEASLQPFLEPELCVARLRPPSSSTGDVSCAAGGGSAPPG